MIILRHDEAEQFWNQVYSAERIVISPWGKTYIITHPISKDVTDANGIFEHTKNKLSNGRYLTDKQIRANLNEKGYFTHDHERSIDTLRKQAHRLLSRYRAFEFRDLHEPAKTILQDINRIVADISKIEAPYQELRVHTAEFHATIHKNLYLLFRCSYDLDIGRRKIWTSFRQVMDDKSTYMVSFLLQELTSLMSGMPDVFMRALARSYIAKSYYEAAQKSGKPMFPRDPSDFSIDQISLINWLSYYESVYKNIGSVPEKLEDNDEKFDDWVKAKMNEYKNQNNKANRNAPPVTRGPMTKTDMQMNRARAKNPKLRKHQFNMGIPKGLSPEVASQIRAMQ